MNVVARRTLCIVPLLLAGALAAQDKPASTSPVLKQGGRSARAAARARVAEPALPPLSPEAQLALDNLAPRFSAEIEQIAGWFRDRPVLYFNFGDVPQPLSAGRVLWPVYGFDAAGDPVAIRGQRPIFSTLPGLKGYSGIWRLVYVVTADHVQPNQLRDVASVNALVRRRRAVLKDASLLVNLPIVARGSALAHDSTPPLPGWFEGREVQFFDFGPVTLAPVDMWRFVRGKDASGAPSLVAGQNSIVDSVPVAGSYPDLWQIHFVQVDSAYAANTLKSAAALRASGFLVEPASSVRNLPITMLDGAPVTRARSPLSRFADLRSPFPPAPTRP